MNQIPKVLHLTSHRVPLRGAQARLARKNRRVLTGWELRVWSDEDNDKLMAQHFPDLVGTFRALPFGVMRADIARLAYMWVHGGWYSDTDYEWLRAPDLPGTVILPMSRDDCVGNAVFGSVAGAPIWEMLIRRILERPGIEQTTREAIEATTGPLGITELITAAWRTEGVVFPPRPYFHSPSDSPVPESYGVHLTHGSWRGNPWRWRLGAVKRRLRRGLSRQLPGRPDGPVPVDGALR